MLDVVAMPFEVVKKVVYLLEHVLKPFVELAWRHRGEGGLPREL